MLLALFSALMNSRAWRGGKHRADSGLHSVLLRFSGWEGTGGTTGLLCPVPLHSRSHSWLHGGVSRDRRACRVMRGRVRSRPDSSRCSRLPCGSRQHHSGCPVRCWKCRGAALGGLRRRRGGERRGRIKARPLPPGSAAAAPVQVRQRLQQRKRQLPGGRHGPARHSSPCVTAAPSHRSQLSGPVAPPCAAGSRGGGFR